MGLDAALEVVPAVLAKRADVVFLFVGARGPLEGAVHAMAARYPGRVHVRVNAPMSDLPKFYAACDVLLAPTRDRHACMGMSIKEAMASGRAVIGSATGGIPEAVVDGETGILVPAGPDLRVAPSALEPAIDLLVGNPELCRRMGEQGRRRAEAMFDNDRSVRRLVEIYRALLN